jgi:small subunit ribosomal protein YMR-31
LGPVEPEKGEYFDRSELGKEYAKLAWTAAEIEAIESGGASMFK